MSWSLRQGLGYYFVNGVTFYRLVAAPVLILLIMTDRFEVFKWMLAVSFFTDAIDGYLARKFNVVSMLGAKLDSVGDDLTVAAGIIGMIVYSPEFLRQVSTPIILLLVLFVLQVSLAFIRYGKMSAFHTYAAKCSALAQGVFLILFFFLDKDLYFLFYVAAGVTAVDLIEEIIIVLLLPTWQTDVKGLFWLIRKRQKSNMKNGPNELL